MYINQPKPALVPLNRSLFSLAGLSAEAAPAGRNAIPASWQSTFGIMTRQAEGFLVLVVGLARVFACHLLQDSPRTIVARERGLYLAKARKRSE
jgi:hypothetical protein